MDTLEFASDQLTRLLNRLVYQVNATIARRDSDAIHDLRVAVRRLAQGLIVFKPCFASKKPKKIRRFLKAIMTRAGEVRDCDIAIQLLSKIQSAGTVQLRNELNVRRRAAVDALLEGLKRWKARRLSAKWRRELEAARLLDNPSHFTIEETARQILPRDAKGFFECGEQAARPQASAEELHRFRIAAKKFRYSLELFADLYQAAASRWLERLKKTQQLLGSVNDCRAARSLISAIGIYRKIEAALKKRQERKMSEFRRFWAHEFSNTPAARQWVALLRHPGTGARPRKPIASSGRPAAVLLAAGA